MEYEEIKKLMDDMGNSKLSSLDIEFPDGIKISMAKTFNANKLQILTKIVIPANISTFINSLKVNIGLSLVGVISGEFLVSKAGLRLFNSVWRSSVSARFSNGKCSNTCSCRSNYV